MNQASTLPEAVLFYSDVPWEGITQRPHHIASGLARKWPVLWVEPITLGHSRHLKAWRASGNLTVISIPLLPLNARHRSVRNLARRAGGMGAARRASLFLQEHMLRAAVRRSGLGGLRHVSLVQNFQFIHVARRLAPAKILFDYIDDAFGFTDYPSWVSDDWRLTIRSSHAITVTSPTLLTQIVEADRECVGRVHRVPNGVDFRRFSDSPAGPRPADLPAGSRPLIGYVGSIYPWIDFELLTHLARELADAWLILVGPSHPEVRGSLLRLARLPNVRVLGSKPYAEVPAYVRAFDVGLVPFRKTRLTAAVNPVKLYEYSAAGVPTVCSDFAPDLWEMHDLIRIAGDRDEFTRHVRRSFLERRDEARVAVLREFARANDWEERIRRIAALLAT